MNLGAPHLHLILNHAPLYFALIGAVLLAIDARYPTRVMRMTAYALLIAGAFAAIATFATGTLAEERLEDLPGAAHAFLEPHEDAGRATLIACLLAGVAALTAALREARGAAPSAVLRTIAIVLAFAAFAIGGYAALLGGEIGHPEIRP